MVNFQIPISRATLRSWRQRFYELIRNPRYSRPSINNIDLKLSKYLDLRNGFFIELGANDGFAQSNTYYLEKLKNWQGILIEPIPELYHQAVKRRPKSRVFNCACVSFDYAHSTIEMTYSNLMSLVKGALKDPNAETAHISAGDQIQNVKSYPVTVEARTLTSILDECAVKRIDFLSLDVEGFELEVLKGLDLHRYRPTYILIEAHFKNDIDLFLAGKYVVIEQLSELDYLYKTLD